MIAQVEKKPVNTGLLSLEAPRGNDLATGNFIIHKKRAI